MYIKKDRTNIFFAIVVFLATLISFMSAQAVANADAVGTDTGIPLSTTHNTRDLGGIINENGEVIRPFAIIRSDSLNKLSAADAATLQNTYHVTNIIDFRSDAEVTAQPDANKAMFFYQHKGISPQLYYLDPNNSIKSLVSKIKNGDQTGDQMMIDMYAYIADSKQSISAYKALFQTLLTNDNATLYHCTSGKDRTGVATALILSALNVDRGVINANYLESNTYRQATIDADLAKAKKYTKDQKVLDILQDMESVKQPYLDAYFNELNAKYGSVNDYLHNQLGLTDQDIQTLQAKYLVNNN